MFFVDWLVWFCFGDEVGEVEMKALIILIAHAVSLSCALSPVLTHTQTQTHTQKKKSGLWNGSGDSALVALGEDLPGFGSRRPHSGTQPPYTQF